MTQILKKYSLFRKNMGVVIDEKVLERFWEINKKEKEGVDNVGEINNPVLEEKINIAKESLKYLLLFNWVKFVAISGSVASGFAKDEDDIDIFVVVKNDRLWIYRAVLLFRNIFHKNIRVGEGPKDVKDKLCMNFLIEERDLELDEDMFNLNEIISLIPIYNESYYSNILYYNPWLFDKYLVSKKNLVNGGEEICNMRFCFLALLNLLCFVAQLSYMYIAKHDPDMNRIWNNYKRGRIEFFPKDFREEKLKELEGR